MKEDILSLPFWFRARVYRNESRNYSWPVRNVVSYLIGRNHGASSRLP